MKMFRRKGFSLAGLMVAIIVIAFMAVVLAPQAEAAEYWKQKYIRFSAPAGETLVTGDIVYIKYSDGEAYKADANDSAKRPAVGVIGRGGTSEQMVEIIAIGILAGQTRVTPGARLFLSETANTFDVAVPPTNEQLLGWVIYDPDDVDSSGVYYINILQMPQSAGAQY